MKKLIWLWLIIIISCDDDKISKTDYEAQFDKVWEDIDKTYSYFELKGIDWDSMYTLYRPRIENGVTTPSEFSEVLQNLILSLKDHHTFLIHGNNQYYLYESDKLYASNAPTHAKKYLTNTQLNTNTLILGTIRDTEILYLHIRNLGSSNDFSGFERVYESLPGASALILDLRDNGGGNDAIARDFVSHLISEPVVYEYVRFRSGPEHNDFGDWIAGKVKPDHSVRFENPIMVLINRNVVSSAESFVAMMDQIPNATLVGDTTRGSTGNPKLFKIPGGWSYRVSSWQAVTPDFQVIEDHGIEPDVIAFNTDESEKQVLISSWKKQSN